VGHGKEQLFNALVLQTSVELTEELLGLVRADPSQVLPHRFVRSSFLAAVRRPLMFALLTGDTELLGKLSKVPLRQMKAQSGDQYSRMMIALGLLRGDVPHLQYTMRAAVAHSMKERDRLTGAASRTLRSQRRPQVSPC
jgi:hypothetical protein